MQIQSFFNLLWQNGRRVTKFCYKNLIESAQGSEEMWRSLNSVLGNKEENFPFQAQNGKRSI